MNDAKFLILCFGAMGLFGAGCAFGMTLVNWLWEDSFKSFGIASKTRVQCKGKGCARP